MAYAMLIDTTRCIACRGCQIACKQANGLEAEIKGFHERRTNPPRLSAKTWNVIDFREVTRNGQESWHFVKRMCLHCNDPACVSACPVGALHKTADGPVLYDGSKCIGCRYCMVACPYDVPGFEWESNSPYIRKCVLCTDRLQQGLQPACVATCPTGAAIFGDRDAMLAEAKWRIAAHPQKYVNHVYGEKEAGGTSVFYLASVPFDQIGLPSVMPETYPKYTWDSLAKVPLMASGVAVLLGGLSLVSWRRNRMSGHRDEEESPAEETSASAEPTRAQPSGGE